MKLTKHAHACVELEKDGHVLVLDPGAFTPNAAELLARAEAVLITHDHLDHFDETAILAALDSRPELSVYGPASVMSKLGEHPGCIPVSDGDSFQAATFTVGVHGHTHAEVHRDIPPASNVGYLIDGSLYHPGDAYFAPELPIDTLLLPTSGPWTKFGEAADFVRSVKPARLIQIHELMMSDLGQNAAKAMLGENGLTGIALSIMPVGESVTL